ncbi:hypothetical protein LCGC14_3030470 [marine sediment metagenome]|uniref:Uncharacterized protein n=1 Tax=marine sediment metagenome TaxID=412755 RepID=A0A0F8XFR4_9ZZZZ
MKTAKKNIELFWTNRTLKKFKNYFVTFFDLESFGEKIKKFGVFKTETKRFFPFSENRSGGKKGFFFLLTLNFTIAKPCKKIVHLQRLEPCF